MKTRWMGLAAGLAFVMLISGACQKGGEQAKPSAAAPAAQAPVPSTEDEKSFYMIGRALGRTFIGWSLSAREVESLQKGVADSVNEAKPVIDLEAQEPKAQQMAQARVAAAAQVNKTKGRAYMDQAAKEAGAVRTASGMIHVTLKPGTGPSPKKSSTVQVQYEGRFIDGTLFDSSLKRGQPAVFPLDKVIPCWQEGIARMKVGEKARLICPSDLAYRDQGQPPVIPGGATLVFETELLSFK